jgi:hypothetical protein
MKLALSLTTTAVVLASFPSAASAQSCGDPLPGAVRLRAALENAVALNNGGLGNDMWATIVDRSGIVCVVVTSAESVNAVWLGSRVISAQKANTGNAFSLPEGATGTDIALSSANLVAAVQPGGSPYG